MDLLKSLRNNWPAVVLLSVVIASVACTLIFASPDVIGPALGAEGIVATLFGLWLRSPRENKERAERRDRETRESGS